MCTILLGVAAVGLAASAAGTIMGAQQQRSVAQAQMNAQVQSQEAQSEGFFQRMNAEGAQNTRDAATQQANLEAQTAAQNQLQQDQQQATAQRESQIDAANTQTQTIGQSAQRLAQTAEDTASAQNQAKAAADEKSRIAALMAPGVQNISTGTTNTPSGPVAAPPSGDQETQQAMAARLAQAAQATRDYSGREATVASYNAPITLMSTTAQDLGASTAPLAQEQKTVETSLQPQLLPSTVAYQSAGNYYQNLLKAIQARTQGQLNVSQAIASGSITNADLAQADATTQAQNQATLAQYRAAMNPMPSILSGVGQLATFGAGAAGAFSGLSGAAAGGAAGGTGMGDAIAASRGVADAPGLFSRIGTSLSGLIDAASQGSGTYYKTPITSSY